MEPTDPVKAAMDALYEAINAKILKDIADTKAKIKADKIVKDQALRDTYKAKEDKSINEFVTETFVQNPTAPDISLQTMKELYEKWYRETDYPAEAVRPHPGDSSIITLISTHPWCKRELYQDFKGLSLKAEVPPEPVLTFEVQMPTLPLPSNIPPVAPKTRGRPKKVKQEWQAAATEFLQNMP